MTKRIAGTLLFVLACGSSQSPKAASGTAQESDTDATSESDEPLLDYDPAALVKFSLVTNSAAPTKDQSLAIGATFEIAEGWHIYWINPGDSGLPTKIKLAPTSGIVIDKPSFPGPVRFDSAGDIVNYGYRGTLIVPMQATVSATAESLTVNASASWLACREDACVPGKGTATMTLGKGLDPAQLQAGAISTAVSALPQPLEAVEALGGKFTAIPGYGETELQIDLPAGYSVALFPQVEKLVRKFSQHTDESGAHFRWRLTTPSDEISLAVLSIQNQRATHFYTITSAHLQTLTQ